jgi:ribonuclease HI
MSELVLNMLIGEKNKDGYCIEISSDRVKTRIYYEPKQKQLLFTEQDSISQILKDNEYQLRTLLHNKRLDTYYSGFSLTFVLRPGKDVAAYNDRSKIVVLDRRNHGYKSYVIEDSNEAIHRIYTDASYSEKSKNGGIAIIHEDLEGNYQLYNEAIEGTSSNMLELLATLRGLEILSEIEAIRVITDSQYVRKGATEWIFNWQHNNWMTANGERVKNIEVWKKLDRLSEDKYIEFQWVKGHTNHFENTLCDLYAKDITKGVGK